MQGSRHQRATGAALSVAVGLLEACAHGDGGHVLLLAGGPCTLGPGQIVSRDYAEPLRTHKDLAKGTAKFFAPSAEFYDAMAHRLIENGQALDVFASCLDQVQSSADRACSWVQCGAACSRWTLFTCIRVSGRLPVRSAALSAPRFTGSPFHRWGFASLWTMPAFMVSSCRRRPVHTTCVAC